jgi:hypothetical protein
MLISLTALLGGSPWPKLLSADADDLQERADHLNALLDPVLVYLSAVIIDPAQNFPDGLDFGFADALPGDLASAVTDSPHRAADDLAEDGR